MPLTPRGGYWNSMGRAGVFADRAPTFQLTPDRLGTRHAM
jgi:hypothetical protein